MGDLSKGEKEADLIGDATELATPLLMRSWYSPQPPL